MCLGGLLDLCLHGLEVEARAFLHRRELDGGPGKLRHLLLDIDEAPELVLEPLEILDRSGESGALEGVEPQVHQDRHVWLDGAAEPAVRLIDEPEFEVVDPRRPERALGEVPDLVALRWPRARDQIPLVVAVEMHLERRIAELLTLPQILDDAWITGGG